jgi:hypothetical protein
MDKVLNYYDAKEVGESLNIVFLLFCINNISFVFMTILKRMKLRNRKSKRSVNVFDKFEKLWEQKLSAFDFDLKYWTSSISEEHFFERICSFAWLNWIISNVDPTYA